VVIQNQLYTVEQFEQFADSSENTDRLLELINGEVVEKVPTEEHGVITVNISSPIKFYLKQNPIGRIGVEIRHRALGDHYNARQPDISVRRDLGSPIVTQGSVMQMPDLAVEVKSPSNAPRELREKAIYYLRYGTKLVWLVYPDTKTVEVCTLSEDGGLQLQTVDESGTLNGGEVLPGFELSIRDIFDV